jgi:hypothetical protein
VPEAGVDAAHELLLQTPIGDQISAPAQPTVGAHPLRLLAGIVVAMAAAGALAWLFFQLAS